MFIHVGKTALPKKKRAPHHLKHINRYERSSDTVVVKRISCLGCGQDSSICLKCAQSRRNEDICEYKKELVVGVEYLFTKATQRAFTCMRHAVLTWIFGSWKHVTRQGKKWRANGSHLMKIHKTRKFWYRWRTYVYKKHTVGAMLLAEQQEYMNQNMQSDLACAREELMTIKQQHQTLLNAYNRDMKHAEKQRDELLNSNKQLNVALSVADKQNDELTNELELLRITVLKHKEMASKVQQLYDYRKCCFQLGDALIFNAATVLEELVCADLQPNLNTMFPKDLLKEIDQPEHMSFYDQIGDRERIDDKVCNTTMAAPDRADRILMKWAVQLAQKYDPSWIRPPSNINNLGPSLHDGSMYAVLLRKMHDDMLKGEAKTRNGLLRTNGVGLAEDAYDRYKELVKREVNPTNRVGVVMKTMRKALWLPEELIQTTDIVTENETFNFTFLSYLFCTAEVTSNDGSTKRCQDLQSELTSIRATWEELKEETEYSDSLAGKTKLKCAHMLEVIKKMQLLNKQSKEGFLIWWKAMRIVLRKAFGTMGKLVHDNQGMINEEVKEDPYRFAAVNHKKLAPLVETVAIDVKSQLLMITEYVDMISGDLARIFRSYNAEESCMMSEKTFKDMIKTCGIYTDTFTVYDFQNILDRVVNASEMNVDERNRPIGPPEFIETLIRIAVKNTPLKHEKTSTSSSLSDTFYYMVNTQLLPLANATGIETFRNQLESPSLKKLLVKHSTVIKKLFNRYAKENDTKKRKKKKMKVFKFVQLYQDYEIVDANFSVEQALNLVRHICRPHYNQDIFDCEFDISLYQELLMATACFKYPDPYLSIQQRVESFFQSASVMMAG